MSDPRDPKNARPMMAPNLGGGPENAMYAPPSPVPVSMPQPAPDNRTPAQVQPVSLGRSLRTPEITIVPNADDVEMAPHMTWYGGQMPTMPPRR